MVSYLPPAAAGSLQGNSPNPPGGGMGNTSLNFAAAAEERFRAGMEQIEADERAFTFSLQQRIAAERSVNEQMKTQLGAPNVAGGMGQMAYGNNQWSAGPAAYARGGVVRVPAYEQGGARPFLRYNWTTATYELSYDGGATWGGVSLHPVDAVAQVQRGAMIPVGRLPVVAGLPDVDLYGEPVGALPDIRAQEGIFGAPFPRAAPTGSAPAPDSSLLGRAVLAPRPAPVAATPVPPAVPAPAPQVAEHLPPPPPPPPSPSPVDASYLHPGTDYISGRPSTTYTGDPTLAPRGAAGVGRGPTVWLGGPDNSWFEAVYDPAVGSWVDVNTARGLGLLYQATGGQRGGRPGTNMRMDSSGDTIPEPPDWDPATGVTPPAPPVTPSPSPSPVATRQDSAGVPPAPPPTAPPDPELVAHLERRRREREARDKEEALQLALADVRSMPPPPPSLSRPVYAKGGAVNPSLPPRPPVVSVNGVGGNAVVGEGRMRGGHRAEVVVLPDATGVFVADRPVIAQLPAGTKIIPADEGQVAQQTAKQLPPAPGTPIKRTAPGRYAPAGKKRG